NTTTAKATFIIDPAASTTARSVTVTTPSGTSNPITFTVTPAVPAGFTLSPIIGTMAGGTRVLITGSNFTSPNVTVKFGNTFGSGARRLSSTQVAVFAPPHATGAVDVTVTSGTPQTQTSAFTFT